MLLIALTGMLPNMHKQTDKGIDKYVRSWLHRLLLQLRDTDHVTHMSREEGAIAGVVLAVESDHTEQYSSLTYLLANSTD